MTVVFTELMVCKATYMLFLTRYHFCKQIQCRSKTCQ